MNQRDHNQRGPMITPARNTTHQDHRLAVAPLTVYPHRRSFCRPRWLASQRAANPIATEIPRLSCCPNPASRLAIPQSISHNSTEILPLLCRKVAASLCSSDYLQGRDPALEAILKGAPTSRNVAGFILYQNGGLSQATVNLNPSVSVGYGTLDSLIEDRAPSGLAVLTTRKDGIAVSEATVPATSALSNGRIYVESQDSVRTGIAFANPNSDPATINFYFTDSAGWDYRHGSMVLTPKSQTARFLDQDPFNGDGGGYSTQIVLISASANQNATGEVYFFSQSGNPWSLTLR